jgi:hypothetical protein
LLQGLPFLDIALVGQKEFDYFVDRFLAQPLKRPRR